MHLCPRLSHQFRPADVQRLSPAALAYIGDAVYELYARAYFLLPPKKIQTYHHQVVAQVRAESQAQQVRSLEPHLLPSELEVFRRGRNAASRGPKRVDPAVYQQATGLETLLGYLYLTNTDRLAELLEKLSLETASQEEQPFVG